MRRPLSATFRLNLIQTFEEAYEDLVDRLCGSAQFGVKPGAEAQYQAFRLRYDREFQYLAPTLGAFEDEPGDLRKLTESATLEEALRQDDGTLIPTILRIRGALDRCAHFLRTLEGAA